MLGVALIGYSNAMIDSTTTASLENALSTVRIVIVDDHRIVRDCLSYFLRSDQTIEIVAEADSGSAAIEACRRCCPDVVLMDLMMPGMNSIDAIRTIRSEFPEVEVVALTGCIEPAVLQDTMAAGAISYVVKDTAPEQLCKVIRDAADGRAFISDSLLLPSNEPSPIETLTPRELEVLNLLAEGRSNGEIAETLCIVERTVKSHVGNVLAKLNLKSRTQAALAARRLPMRQTK
jgi:NarL family two-component system response regulator LiaR